MTRIFALTASVLLVVLLGLMWVLSSGRAVGDAFAACRSTRIAGGASTIGGSFTLVNGAGQTVTDTDVITQPSLVYFGYTFCPDVCPLDNVRNAEAVDLLQESGHSVIPVFISIDPERDTPEVVADYAELMHENMIGLTGTLAQVKAASQAYKTYFEKQDSGDEFYLMNHTTFTYLVLPEQGFVEFFRRDVSAEEVAKSVACFADAA